MVEWLHAALEAHDRDPASFPIQATVAISDDFDDLERTFSTYLEAGFTRLGLHLSGVHDEAGSQRRPVEAQLEAIRTNVWLKL